MPSSVELGLTRNGIASKQRSRKQLEDLNCAELKYPHKRPKEASPDARQQELPPDIAGRQKELPPLLHPKLAHFREALMPNSDMAYTPSPAADQYHDSSSLDPLAISGVDELAQSQKFLPSSPIRLPRSSPMKAMRFVEDISMASPYEGRQRTSRTFSSPSKRVSHQALSPWRIRVTVEAEPEEMESGNTRTTKRTMQVPLRGGSPKEENPWNEKHISRAGASWSKRRSTPVPAARSASRGRRQSVTDLGITVLGDEEDGNEWSPHKSKKRGRPRVKKNKQVQDHESSKADLSHHQADALQADKEIDREVEDECFQIRQDSDTELQTPAAEPQKEDSPELRQLDLNRVSVRSRSHPPKQNKVPLGEEAKAVELPRARVPLPGLDTSRAVSEAITASYPTPTSSTHDDFENEQHVLVDPTERHEGFDTILESEGFTMIDIDTIPSVRQFLSSPLSEEQHEKSGPGGTPAQKSVGQIALPKRDPSMDRAPIPPVPASSQPKPRLSAIPSYLILPDGESDLSSTVPSSPPVRDPTPLTSPSPLINQYTKRTPEVLYSSPRLPSPPKPLAIPTNPHSIRLHKSTPPKLARVVRTGIALQGVLSPKSCSARANPASTAASHVSPKERLDNLFEGFDSGTKRELRAGLRFGEELAKRQRSSSPAQVKQRVAKPPTHSQVWRGETIVQHTPVILPANAEVMVDKRALSTSTTTKVEPKRTKHSYDDSRFTFSTPAQKNAQLDTPVYPNTQTKERQWQLERQMVSQQIENANISQVIVIGSDDNDDRAHGSSSGASLSLCINQDVDEDQDETNGDVWLAEAEAHNSSQNQEDKVDRDPFPPTEQERRKERAREAVNKPRRSLIPSPWKRGEDIDGGSTFMTNSDMSGLFWQQPRTKVRFGSGAIERQLKGRSSSVNGVVQSTSDDSRERNELPSPSRGFCKDDSAHENGEELPARPQEEKANLDKTGLDTDEDAGKADTDKVNEVDSFEIYDHEGWGVTENDCQDEESINDHGKTTTTCNADPHEEDILLDEISSSRPQAVKIPVNFNDSTLTAPPLTPSFVSSTPQSSRPTTPRSALKGSRIDLGVEENKAKKVVFSSNSFCVDDSGNRSSLRIKSMSPTPPPSIIPGILDQSKPASPPPSLSKEKSKPIPKSWLGWLLGESKSSVTTVSSSDLFAKAATSVAVATATESPADTERDLPTTKSTISTTKRPSTRSDKHALLPSYLQPPSYPSDPSRDPAIPLATSGSFTDTHFRTLHILYKKSLGRKFHAPAQIRPGLQKCMSERFECDEQEGGYGYFAWEVDHDAVVVLERFMQEVEFGHQQNRENRKEERMQKGRTKVMWKWTEKELCQKLFRIIVGEEVRREQGLRMDEMNAQAKAQRKSVEI